MLNAPSYESAYNEFTWPQITNFNWVRHYFEPMADRNHKLALQLVDPQGATYRTFYQLLQRSAQVANFFDSLNLKKGDRVMYMLPNDVASWECTLAGIRSALVMIPSSTALTAQDIAYRVKHANIQVVVTTQKELPKFEGLKRKIMFVLIDGVPPNRPDCVDYKESLTFSDEYNYPTNASDDPLICNYTSGTTKPQPSGVIHTHVSLPIGSLSTMFWQGVKPDDIMAYIAANGWAMSLWMFFGTWNAEATIFSFAHPKFHAPTVLDILARYPVTHFYAPPAAWRPIAQHLEQSNTVIRLPSLRRALSAGETLNDRVHACVLEKLELPLYEGYGQTETTLVAGFFPGQNVIPGALGYPAPGHTLRILDAMGNDASKGELAIVRDHDSGFNITPGYIADDSKKLPTKPRHKLYCTGDLVTREGNLSPMSFFARKSDEFFIKSNGFRISPLEIESKLLAVPDVFEAAVIPKPHPMKGNEIIAYVVLKEGSNTTAQHVLEEVNKTLAKTHQIVEIILCQELPKTISGKIQHAVLRARVQEHTQAAQPEDERYHSPAL